MLGTPPGDAGVNTYLPTPHVALAGQPCWPPRSLSHEVMLRADAHDQDFRLEIVLEFNTSVTPPNSVLLKLNCMPSGGNV